MENSVNLGRLYTVSAPSGAGKTSLMNALIAADQEIVLSVSYTTRSRRSDETEGKDYYFVSEDEFLQKVAAGEFLEHAQVFGNYYGTSQAVIEQRLREGRDVILEIDWQGMQQVRHLKPESISIFILPPSRLALEKRLRGRAQDTEAVITKRMAAAREEVSHYVESDYLVINDDFQRALSDLLTIVRSQRLRLNCQRQRYVSLLTDLLS